MSSWKLRGCASLWWVPGSWEAEHLSDEFLEVERLHISLMSSWKLRGCASLWWVPGTHQRDAQPLNFQHLISDEFLEVERLCISLMSSWKLRGCASLWWVSGSWEAAHLSVRHHKELCEDEIKINNLKAAFGYKEHTKEQKLKTILLSLYAV